MHAFSDIKVKSFTRKRNSLIKQPHKYLFQHAIVKYHILECPLKENYIARMLKLLKTTNIYIYE